MFGFTATQSLDPAREMQAAEKHERSWKVRVDARSSGLRFKLKVAKASPGHRISLLLRLRKFVFNLTAGSKPSLPSSPLQRLNRRSTDCKSRFRRAFQKLRWSRRFKCSHHPVSPQQQQPSFKIPDSKFLGNPLKRIMFEVQDPNRVGCSWTIAILVAIIALFFRFPRDPSWERTIQFLVHAINFIKDYKL